MMKQNIAKKSFWVFFRQNLRLAFMASIMSVTAVTFTAIALEHTGEAKVNNDLEKSKEELGALLRRRKPSQ